MVHDLLIFQVNMSMSVQVIFKRKNILIDIKIKTLMLNMEWEIPLGIQLFFHQR